MKSYGHMFEQVVAEANLQAALGRVMKGRTENPQVAAYAARAKEELAVLRRDLISGSWQPGAYLQFRVTDPKPRIISCAPVRDRVVHHALCGVVAPLLERSFTEDCYACRVGKGSHRAAGRARDLAGRFGWFCKLDVRRYFDSIDHEVLLGLLQPVFREASLRGLIEQVVRHPVPGLPLGRGVPIGNLTSQWFANFYLCGLDHFAKERLKAPGYVRYMDDLVLFAESKADIWRLHDEVCRWVAVERRLELKAERMVLSPVSEGLPFLGLRIFPGQWRLQRARLQRTRRKLGIREREYLNGDIDEKKWAACVAALEAGIRCYGFRGVLRSRQNGEGFGVGGERAESGSNRVNRGGSWNNAASNCRSAYRNSNTPSNRNNNIGFRLASTLQKTQAVSHPPSPVPCNRKDE